MPEPEPTYVEDFIQQNSPNADLGSDAGVFGTGRYFAPSSSFAAQHPTVVRVSPGRVRVDGKEMSQEEYEATQENPDDKIEISTSDRVSMLTKQFQDGKINRDDFNDNLLNLGYEPKDIDMIAKTAEKTKNVPV